jgi:hypothetical protein
MLIPKPTASSLARRSLMDEPKFTPGPYWLIEAVGPFYLSVRELGRYEFFWTRDHDAALRFYSEAQADTAMFAIRELSPGLFAFAGNLEDPRPVAHQWIGPALFRLAPYYGCKGERDGRLRGMERGP